MADQKIAKCPMPGCGGECEIDYEGFGNVVFVECLACGYRSRGRGLRKDAIADHNAVSDAVATADADAGMFDAVEADMERRVMQSSDYRSDSDTFDDPFVQAVYAAYKARIEAIG